MSRFLSEHKDARTRLITIAAASLLVGMACGYAVMRFAFADQYVAPIPSAWLAINSSTIGLFLGWCIFAGLISIRRIGERVFASKDIVQRISSRGTLIGSLVWLVLLKGISSLVEQPTRLPPTPPGPVQTVVGWSILILVGLLAIAGLSLALMSALEKPWNPREHEKQKRSTSESR